MEIIRNILKARSIEPVEAGASHAPGKSAFCTKICSKIITAQFCVVLLNNDESNGSEVPNANVNMEHGLMLGFNKYVIPFQRATQKLPFNVSGLDTIKYSNKDFERLAAVAVDQAIEETTQSSNAAPPTDQILDGFLLAKKKLVTQIQSDGDRNIFNMGHPFGFNLLNDFSGMAYTFLGNFTSLRREAVIWRARMLIEVLTERRLSFGSRVSIGMATEEQARFFDDFLSKMSIWLVVTTDEEKSAVETALHSATHNVTVFSQANLLETLEELDRENA